MTGSGTLRQRRAIIFGLEAILLAVLAWLVVAGVFVSRAAGPAAIAVDAVWARATPPGVTTGAVYLTIANSGGRSDALVRVSTPASRSVVIHQTSIQADIATMQPLPGGLVVDGGEDVVLEPGGEHLMLVDLTAALVEGTTVPLVLEFVEAGRIEVEAAVLGFGAMGPAPTP